MEVAFKRFSRMMPARNTAGAFIEKHIYSLHMLCLKASAIKLGGKL
jgi:hypothetical protein